MKYFLVIYIIAHSVISLLIAVTLSSFELPSFHIPTKNIFVQDTIIPLSFNVEKSYHLPIFVPPRNIDFKILRVYSDHTIDFKILTPSPKFTTPFRFPGFKHYFNP